MLSSTYTNPEIKSNNFNVTIKHNKNELSTVKQKAKNVSESFFSVFSSKGKKSSSVSKSLREVVSPRVRSPSNRKYRYSKMNLPSTCNFLKPEALLKATYNSKKSTLSRISEKDEENSSSSSKRTIYSSVEAVKKYPSTTNPTDSPVLSTDSLKCDIHSEDLQYPQINQPEDLVKIYIHRSSLNDILGKSNRISFPYIPSVSRSKSLGSFKNASTEYVENDKIRELPLISKETVQHIDPFDCSSDLLENIPPIQYSSANVSQVNSNEEWSYASEDDFSSRIMSAPKYIESYEAICSDPNQNQSESDTTAEDFEDFVIISSDPICESADFRDYEKDRVFYCSLDCKRGYISSLVFTAINTLISCFSICKVYIFKIFTKLTSSTT